VFESKVIFGPKMSKNIFKCEERLIDWLLINVQRAVVQLYSGRNTYKASIRSNERRLKNYRGAISTRPLKSPGKYYFEVIIDYRINKPLDNVNFVFESEQ
jgi:hypothetical protein